MKIIVPMAGRGSRLRPHTLTVPKPLIPVAGKPIVQRIVEDIASVCNEPIDEIAFIIGDFGKEVENNLIKVAENLGAKGSIYYQEEALGTAHAILCAANSLSGRIVVAFADTLFRADFKLDSDADGIIWVNRIDDPSAFGVVKMNEEGVITDFVEKPKTFVSDLAIIGIYYFKDGENLRNELQFLIDNDIKDKGEYQLTNALENMKNKGLKFKPGQVVEWLDCGNKNATVYSNQRVLESLKNENLVDTTVQLENSVIIPPCFIGKHVKLVNSVVGPYVSIGDDTQVYDSRVFNSIIQSKSHLSKAIFQGAMIGNHSVYQGVEDSSSLGDYTQVNLN
ncbi:MAG: sugar phosphate nucleotidyltransferase [Flavobacteriales bacterium]